MPGSQGVVPGSQGVAESALVESRGYKFVQQSTPLFLLHTYLVGTLAIKKALGYDLSPALHSAEVKVIELPSGTSSAKFLMSTFYLFIIPFASGGGLEKSVLDLEILTCSL